MAYKVIQAFTDLKDGDKVYRVGDIYDGEDPKRIKDLLADDNKGRHGSLKGKPLIESDSEQTEAKETPDDEVKAPKKGGK
jgi:hypothetical protein